MAARLYPYHHRIADRHHRPVVSLAVLADNSPGFPPGPYEEATWGYRKQDILKLYRLIDWPIRLPEELAVEFRRELIH